ncbi:MAG: hypothetical protein ABI082_14205 [Dokdonella sp.]
MLLFPVATLAGGPNPATDAAVPDPVQPELVAAPTSTALTDQRFSLIWLSGSTPHRAAIRGDASIRDTDDVGLVVTHVAPGQYCIHATSPNEGAVGVLQDQGGTHGTIDVSMGIGSFCNPVSGANITVQTWQIP